MVSFSSGEVEKQHIPTSASVLMQLSMLVFWAELIQVQLYNLKADWSSLMKTDWFVWEKRRESRGRLFFESA